VLQKVKKNAKSQFGKGLRKCELTLNVTMSKSSLLLTFLIIMVTLHCVEPSKNTAMLLI
jgi:hypothetical protein